MGTTDGAAALRGILLQAAAELLPGEGPLTVILLRGQHATLVEGAATEPTPPGKLPASMQEYDRRIVEALTDRRLSRSQLARAAGHRDNRYFGERLTRLVEAGWARYSRRGYDRGFRLRPPS